MIKVAITGGIGTGKTTISSMFSDNGVPVFNSDDIAKEIMNKNSLLRNEIITAFGDKAYDENKLNREYISDLVFNNETLLKKINSIVHPYVTEEFNSWIEKQESKYIIYESAIIFENQAEDFFDKIICVTSSEENVISRIIKRNNFSADKIKSIINKQLPNDVKIQKSDYVIENTNTSKLPDKVLEIHNDIMGSI